MFYAPGAVEYVDSAYADRVIKNGLAVAVNEPWEVETATVKPKENATVEGKKAVAKAKKRK